MEIALNQNNVSSAVAAEEGAKTADNNGLIFYGTKEVAKMFHCSIPTAREIMRRADFPLLIVGGKWIVLKTALELWASERRA